MMTAQSIVEYQCEGATFDAQVQELHIDLSRPRKIRVVARDERGDGLIKEYFLKVTERKGLVLV